MNLSNLFYSLKKKKTDEVSDIAAQNAKVFLV